MGRSFRIPSICRKENQGVKQKGAIMPIILIICFLFSALLLFQIKIYVNEKQNIRHEQRVLTLEWLLRNAEKQLVEGKEYVTEEEGSYDFPNGEVYYKTKKETEDSFSIELRAKDNLGNERNHDFYIVNEQGE